MQARLTALRANHANQIHCPILILISNLTNPIEKEKEEEEERVGYTH